VRRSLLLLVAAVLVVGGIVVWRAGPRDPGPVGPPLSARLWAVTQHRIDGDVTYLGRGPRGEAHGLWMRYHDQPAYQGVKPRLLGISRVHISSEPDSFSPTGDYWVVFCDQVWSPNLGGFGDSPGAYGREIVLVRQGAGTTSGNIMLF
jgi:hypothetical protein